MTHRPGCSQTLPGWAKAKDYISAYVLVPPVFDDWEAGLTWLGYMGKGGR